MNEQSPVRLRIAVPEDAAALLAIYAPYVEKTIITFEYEVPTPEEFRARIEHTLECYPYLVAAEGDELLGYAYASSFKARAAYDWSAETSIYLREDARGRGIGRMLYQALEQNLRRQHVCNLCACIAHPHPESEDFHEKCGYRTVAHFHQSGYKNGRWIDMIWMEKELCPHTVPPQPFIPFSKLSFDDRYPAPNETNQTTPIRPKGEN